MPSVLLFCTSAKVTSRIVRDLQLANEECPVASPFSPARLVVADQEEPNRCVPEDDVEIFEGVTDSQLRELYTERQEASRWIEPGFFAALDARGAESKTVVVHYYNILLDYDTADVIGKQWVTWRVSFNEVNDMIAQLMTTPEIIERVYLNCDHLIDENGVFPVWEAERQMGYPR